MEIDPDVLAEALYDGFGSQELEHKAAALKLLVLQLHQRRAFLKKSVENDDCPEAAPALAHHWWIVTSTGLLSCGLTEGQLDQKYPPTSKSKIHGFNPGHVPAITQQGPHGQWGVYCWSCSMAKGDYVYPCKVLPVWHWPPQSVYAIQEALF